MDPKTILNVGDRVVVREDLKGISYDEDRWKRSLSATTRMTALAGETVVISKVVYGWNAYGDKDWDDDPRRYFVREEQSDEDVKDEYGTKLFWCPSMFSGFAEDSEDSLFVPQNADELFEAMLL